MGRVGKRSMKKSNKYKYYVIYSLTPAPLGKDYHRLVECFDNKKDAESVLSILEKVNVLFHCYKIVKEYLEDIKNEKIK